MFLFFFLTLCFGIYSCFHFISITIIGTFWKIFAVFWHHLREDLHRSLFPNPIFKEEVSSHHANFFYHSFQCLPIRVRYVFPCSFNLYLFHFGELNIVHKFEDIHICPGNVCLCEPQVLENVFILFKMLEIKNIHFKHKTFHMTNI